MADAPRVASEWRSFSVVDHTYLIRRVLCASLYFIEHT